MGQIKIIFYPAMCAVILMQFLKSPFVVVTTNMCILDDLSPIHVSSNHVASDKLTNKNGEMFTN